MTSLNYLDKNIYFYSLLKILLQIKPDFSIKGEITNINQQVRNSGKSELILKWKNLQAQKEFNTLFPLAYQLMTFKEWVIKRTKEYLEEYKLPDLFPLIDDKLSLTYDDLNLTFPYSYRTLSNLILSNGKRQVFNGDEFWQVISKEKEEIFNNNNLKEKLIQEGIHGLPLVSVIIDESINQSIRSSAGADYHSRIKETFNKFDNWKLITEKKQDAKKKGIEYDFIYSYKEKKIGISAKRTLRERWKQNWADCFELEVDLMLLINLGTDLNENKLETILGNQGWYVIVAYEVYEKKDYFQNNSKVFASNQLIDNFLDKAFELEEKKLK